MFKNHLKIAWRSLSKDKLFTVIKIGGFAIGITACLLIALFIRDELSYDKYYKDQQSIYRVILEGFIDGEMRQSVHFQLPFADKLQSDFPEIIKAGKYNASELFGAGKKTLRIQGQPQNYIDEDFIFASPNLVDILEIPFKEGNPENSLSQPYSLVISADKAAKYFPGGNALGQTIILDDDSKNPYRITGVMAERTTKSHFDYDFLMPIRDENMAWLSNNYLTYVKVDQNANIAELEDKMHSIIMEYVVPAMRENKNRDVFIEVLKKASFILQPVADIHLKTNPKLFDHLHHGDIRFVWLFAAIAGFILLLACINFINLSTAKSANRAKEVGLRKTVGAFRKNLIVQFITESVLFSFISFALGLLLTWTLLPVFNSIASKSLSIPFSEWWFIPILLLSAILTGIAAGIYPALYLSSFRPVNVLKGSLSLGGKSGKMRSGLVVFQFTTSIILIIGTLVISQQMDYILNKKLGYDKEQVLILQGTQVLGNKTENFKQQLMQLPGVKTASVSDYLPIEGSKQNQNTFKKVGEGSEDQGISSQIWSVDYDYVHTLGIQIKDGRDFSKEFASDSINTILINESMAAKLGYEDPLGKQISNGTDWTIIGVMKDFNFLSLKEDIYPLTLVIGNSPGMIAVKLNTDHVKGAIASIGASWKNNVPDQAMSYSFLDQDFAQMHADVKRMGYIFNSFALFALLVACLGLFALSAFMAEQRSKEISIRMVLGASFRNIYELLSIDFLKLVGLSLLIAIPIGWFIMNRWLEDFAFRITIGWEIFVWAGVIAVVIALMTISYQSIGAALIKPLKSLRTE